MSMLSAWFGFVRWYRWVGLGTLFAWIAAGTLLHAEEMLRLALGPAGSLPLVTFAFLLVAYRMLPNTELTTREVLPGTILATILLQASFEVLPLYLRYSDQLVALRAFGGLVILLVWLYLMANILILGAEINWSHWLRAHGRADDDLTGLA